MAILCIEEAEEAKRWQSALKRELPDADIRIWPDVGEPKDIRMVVLWDEVDQINALPNLQAAVILGAGIEHLLPHVESIPAAVKIIRLVDKSITSQMLEWVTLAVLTRTRFWDEYRDLQRHKRYEELVPPAPSEVTVGIMGLGVLGRETAQLLAAIGYTVMGWSRSAKMMDGIECFHGRDHLATMLSVCDIAICMLPLTRETEGLIDRNFFAAMKSGAYFINAARGAHVVEADLLDALESGDLSGATLDVHTEEPMSEEHPFWDHPKIKITPHIATFTFPRFCAAQVAENYRRLNAGTELLNVIDMSRQY